MRILSMLFVCSMFAAAADEKDQVIAVVNKVFAGMSAKDADAIASSMTEDAKLISVSGDRAPAVATVGDFVKRITGGANQIVERMWEPTVLIRGRIAMLWAEYDVHVGGKFNHCGIDAFMLIKTGEGWKISEIEYTSETEGCTPSPLGPITK